MNRYGTSLISDEEVFNEENGFMVSNKLYTGISTANGGVNAGYKVINKSGRFMGLLDHEKLALWWTKEDTLELI